MQKVSEMERSTASTDFRGDKLLSMCATEHIVTELKIHTTIFYGWFIRLQFCFLAQEKTYEKPDIEIR
jgi:hypothetical protein